MSDKKQLTPTEQAYLDYAQRKISYQQYRAKLEEIRKEVQANFEITVGPRCPSCGRSRCPHANEGMCRIDQEYIRDNKENPFATRKSFLK